MLYYVVGNLFVHFAVLHLITELFITLMLIVLTSIEVFKTSTIIVL